MTRFLKFTIVLLGLLTIGANPLAAAAPAPSLQWEVANRFRLFKDETHFRAIADAYDTRRDQADTSSPAMELELELEHRAQEHKLGFGDPQELAQYGWASAVDATTCFQSRNRGHWPCLLKTHDEFVQPKHFDLLVRLADLPAAQSRTCSWTVSGMAPIVGGCDQQVRFEGIEFSRPFSITVAESDIELAKLDAQSARSVVLVGLGDSFASGEGNPDRQAVLGDSFSNYEGSSLLPGSTLLDPKTRQYPIRPGSTPSSLGLRSSAAVWLNPQCHRSLYSHQLKAALQLAILERHLAVTFLGYSCTGAEVTAGILNYWAARDDVTAPTYDASPQIMRFLRDACVDQKPYAKYSDLGSFRWRDMPPCGKMRLPAVDAVLLSIGGNDVGFSNVIANEVVDVGGRFSPFRRLLYRLWLQPAGPIPFAEAEKRARALLPTRLDELAEAVRTRLGVSPKVVIQTAYPQYTELTGGKVCPASTDGMDVHEILGMRKASTGPDAAAFVTRFNGIIRDTIQGLGAERSWTFVDSHVALFAGHAICAGGAPNGIPAGKMSGGMNFPSWDFARRRWTLFHPSDWIAYLPRNRWFVTPNDAFLTSNYMNVTSGTSDARDRAQPLYAATLSGSFHPNALGQAAMADAVLPELRRALGL